MNPNNNFGNWEKAPNWKSTVKKPLKNKSIRYAVKRVIGTNSVEKHKKVVRALLNYSRFHGDKSKLIKSIDKMKEPINVPQHIMSRLRFLSVRLPTSRSIAPVTMRAGRKPLNLKTRLRQEYVSIPNHLRLNRLIYYIPGKQKFKRFDKTNVPNRKHVSIETLLGNPNLDVTPFTVLDLYGKKVSINPNTEHERETMYKRILKSKSMHTEHHAKLQAGKSQLYRPVTYGRPGGPAQRFPNASETNVLVHPIRHVSFFVLPTNVGRQVF